MNTGTRNVIIGLLAWMVTLQTGSGFYNPETGRWLSRDPIEEPGFQKLHGYRGTLSAENVKNVYCFTLNSAINRIDLHGLNCACGPDITDALKATLDEVAQKFGALGPLDKLKACGTILGVGNQAESAWDINALAYTSPQFRERMPGVPDPLEKGVTSHCCTRSCTDTVVVAGKCVFSHQATYVLFGQIGNLCGLSTTLLHPAIDAWKKKTYPKADKIYTEQAHALTDYGNQGTWPTSFDGLESTDCFISKNHKKTAMQKFKWTWEPFQPRTYEP